MWDYAQSKEVAADYDQYFGDHPLFEIDARIIEESFDPVAGKVVVDLGCGTGRALKPLVQRGATGIAVDLSHEMLSEVAAKVDACCVRANLADLSCFGDATCDHALCLFNTLGMIRGRGNRQRTLKHVARMLKPGGVFVLHVHNAWRNILDPGGIRWLGRSLRSKWRQRDFEWGDKTYDYRGIPNFFLHTFWPAEIRFDIGRADLGIERVIPLNTSASRTIEDRFSRWSAGGWIFVCRKANHKFSTGQE